MFTTKRGSAGSNICMTYVYTLGNRAAGREMGKQLFLSRRHLGFRIWLCSGYSRVLWLGKMRASFCHFHCKAFFSLLWACKRLLGIQMSPQFVPTTREHTRVYTCTTVSGLLVFQSLRDRHQGGCVACSHVRMKNEPGCHGWLLVAVGAGQLSHLD